MLSKLDPYNTFKQLVVKETDLSDYQRLEKLPALGDQRTSELLASIRNLHSEPHCKFYCSWYQFLSRTPPFMIAQLVSKKDLTVDELVALANNITLSQTTNNNLMAEAVSEHLKEEVCELRPKLPAKKKSSASASMKSKPELYWFHNLLVLSTTTTTGLLLVGLRLLLLFPVST